MSKLVFSQPRVFNSLRTTPFCRLRRIFHTTPIHQTRIPVRFDDKSQVQDPYGYQHFRKQPQRTSNVQIFMYVLGGVIVLYLVTHIERTPVTNRYRFIFMSKQSEKELGNMLFQQLKANALPPNHPAAVLIRDIGRRIEKVTGASDYDWEYVVVDDPSVINAMCLPGGKVVFFTGLLNKLERKGEVAAILSHEIAHALLRHVAERQAFQGLLFTTLFVVRNILGIFIPPELVALGMYLPYSRKQESEADEIGLYLMARACYDPKWAIQAHTNMERAIGKQEYSVLRYFSTHPDFESRIEALRKLLPKAERERAKFCRKYAQESGFEYEQPVIHHWYDGLDK